MTLSELAEKIGAKLSGNGDVEVYALNSLESAKPGHVSFMTNPRYRPQLASTAASAVIVSADTTSDRLTLLCCPDPQYAMMQASVLLHGHRRHPHQGVHPDANVDPSATIGENSVIYPGAYIGKGVVVGRDCVVYPNAVVYENCRLGDRVILQAGAVIGADGFGYATHKGVHHKIPQAGNVVLEDDVEIGANSCIDRAAIGSTVIGRGTKIDNLVQIAHNVRIGPHSVVVSQTGIAGSVKTGRHAVIAGQVGIAGHVELGDQVTIGAQSGVLKDVPSGSTLMGTPAVPVKQGLRIWSISTKLPELADRVRELERRLEKLGEKAG